MKNYDAIIIGGGPAGISAALYLARGGAKTMVLDSGTSALNNAEKIQNYYGFVGEDTSGKTLLETGLSQAKALGVEVINGEVTEIEYDMINEKVTVKIPSEEFSAPTLLLATGKKRNAPKFKGVKEYEGHGVSYCATCDAFFYRGKNVVVIGNGKYALGEASALALSSNVIVLSDGQELKAEFPSNIPVNPSPIAEIKGENGRVTEVEFKDGTILQTDGVFIALGTASASDFAMKLGLRVENGNILVDENCATDLLGVYAAGDCTGGTLQVAKAVNEGMVAGTEMLKLVKKLKK